MRVLQIYRDYFTEVPGGIERHVRELAWGIPPDIEVEVMASARALRPSVFQDGPATVHLVAELARPGGVPLWRGAARVFRQGHFDLVHLHVPNPTGEYLYSIFGRGVPSIVTYHADVHRNPRFARLYHRHLTNTLAHARRILVSSQELAASSPMLSQITAQTPERTEIVPFGVDTERFSPKTTERSQRYRERWGDLPTVLFVGRLRHYKGLDFLVRAVAAAGCRLVVAGDGPGRDRFLDEAGAHLRDRFHYLAGVTEEDLPDLYRAADVFCLPSTTPAETFGIVVLEAMSSGLPVITTELGTATSKINVSGETGLVVPPSDSDSLARAIQSLIGDPSRLSAMARAARDRVLESFDRAGMLARVRKIYRDVVQEEDIKGAE